MSIFSDPFESRFRLRKTCSCGAHADEAEHHAALKAQSADPVAKDSEKSLRRVVEGAVMRALFPQDKMRRAFLRAVGSATASAALASIFPLSAATEVFAGPGKLEKTSLKIGFLPITCATPIIMGAPLGFYAKQGLNVQLIKTAGWAVVRDKSLDKEYDAAHMLAPMPVAISLGLGSTERPFLVPVIENLNGQAICLAMKHKNRRNPKDWNGFKFAIPFDYSNHNYLLRYYLAEYGIDPDVDVQLRVLPPPDMVANLRAENIDGFLAPDNLAQRAVYDGIGFIHLLSKEIWDGHPCCAFSVSRPFMTEMPNTYAALLRAIVGAAAYASKPEHRKEIAAAIAPANYINMPEIVLEQCLTGTYADGLGHVKHDPNRVTFDPFPWESFGIWILTQMKRWGQIKGDVDYQGIAREVFLATDAAKAMREAGLTPPSVTTKSFSIMGKVFDPAKPAEYAASFAIKRG